MPATRLTSLLPLSLRQKWWHLLGLTHRPLGNLLRVVAAADYARTLTLYHNWQTGSRAPYIPLHLRGLRRPIVLRRRSSDFDVFAQVFILQHYARLPVCDPRIIIDAGANVGLSTLFFLRTYPRAHVIALEPDPANYDVAVKNLRDFTTRCTLLRAALWSGPGEVAVRRGTFGDGRQWATQVSPEVDGAPLRVPAYSVRDLMTQFHLTSIDLLKIDIEGAEEAVFGSGDVSFLDHVRCIAVELHGEPCQRVFHDSTRGHNFAYSQRGEITVAMRLD
jgi:FkbM family methyltransferase